MYLPTSLNNAMNTVFNFLGREPEWDREVEHHIDVEDVYVKNTSELPNIGEEGIKYTVTEDMSVWRWADGAYHETNPYVYGVDQQYRDTPRTIRPNSQIVDPSAELASLSLDQVREGSSPSLAVYYNLIALRADLALIRRTEVLHPNMSLMGIISAGPSSKPENNVTDWFIKNHRALHVLLSSSARSKATMFKAVVDVLNHNKASLTWDDDKNRAVFKTDDIKVYL